MEDIIIIGAGATGSFIARNLSAYHLEVLVLDKENDVANGTTNANSAIAHSGYDPLPGSLKARFNVLGNRMMDRVCEELDVPFNRCGTLTIALEEKQLATLSELQKRGEANGVPTRLCSAEEVLSMEPHINKSVKGALLCPTGGILNPFLLAIHAMENAIDNGVKLALNEEVLAIDKIAGGYRVRTAKNAYETRMVINAAGVYADKIAKMVGPVSWSIKPRKGSYYVLDHYGGDLVNHVLFPLPSEKGKGILVTRTTTDNYLVGPSSNWQDDRDDVSTDPFTMKEVREQATLLVPSIPFNQQIRVYSGLRATPSTHDFIIEPSAIDPYFINVAGIESPGLVSSPAIGAYVAQNLVIPLLKPSLNESFNPRVKPYPHPQLMPLEERRAFIAEHPKYGHILCDCEKVSEGEMLEALSRSVPCHSVKAMKKRVRAGFGKCQGGFCQPKVMRLMAQYYGVSIKDIPYDKEHGYILKEESKKGEEGQ